jgi:hypothetical protein
MKKRLAAGIVVFCGMPAFAHRLDEYLQATIISVEKTRLEAELTLTPGVAVFPAVISWIDTDGNGAITEPEQRAYAVRVLRDLSLGIDGHPLAPRLLSITFPPVDDLKEGRGEIKLTFAAGLPAGGRNRKILLQNHHMMQIAAYQVNCLVPRDHHIRIDSQNRNYSQSSYELDYEQTDVAATSSVESWSGRIAWLSPLAILLFLRFTRLRRSSREGLRL